MTRSRFSGRITKPLGAGGLFARFDQRTGTVVPLLAAHAAIDIAAFLGNAELAGHVTWLPTPH